MKKLCVYAVILVVAFSGVSFAFAGSCQSDTVVKRWIEERDRKAVHIVRAWAGGTTPRELASEIAVILSNEFYMCSKCRNEIDFLKTNLRILNGGSSPKMETIPAVILEQLMGYPVLSPWTQFPARKRDKEGVENVKSTL